MTHHVVGDRYELGEVIGTGGMSDVYAATDTLLGRDVAVKMMRAELARDVNFRERFRREAQNAGRLNHPSVVAIIDTGETVNHGITIPYIVMERVHGRTLRDIVHNDGPMSPAEAARTLVPVCGALQASHDAGIVHRDIKPANIMITNTGSVKVMDFGIARALDDATSAMTQTSAVIGTAQYLSPEQARGKAADARSDVYALGCVLYEAVTGRPPFEGESPFAVAFNHVHENPEPPSAYIPNLTPTAALNIDAVVLLAMAKHPGDRYQTAAELADDLTLLSRNAVSNAARSHMRPAPDPTPAAATTTHIQRQAPAPESRPDQHDPALLGAGTVANTDERGRRYAAESGRHSRQRNRFAGVWGLLLLIGIIAAALVAVKTLHNNGTGPESSPGDGTPSVSPNGTVEVPDVKGQSRFKAVTMLEALGLRVVVNEEPNPTLPAGDAIATSPGAGSSLQPGATITLTISSGKELTEVPDLSGLNTEQAERELTAVGLLLDPVVRELPHDDVPESRIIEQHPPAHDPVPKGSKVIITVSTGPQLIAVPQLVGQNVDEAQAALNNLGLVPVVQHVASDLPLGTVTGMPDQGKQLTRGKPVTLQVSDATMFRIPDLTGMTAGQALAALRAAGWTSPDTSLLQQPVQTGALIEQDQIAGQTPLPGELTAKDGLVSIRVKKFDLLKILQP